MPVQCSNFWFGAAALPLNAGHTLQPWGEILCRILSKISAGGLCAYATPATGGASSTPPPSPPPPLDGHPRGDLARGGRAGALAAAAVASASSGVESVAAARCCSLLSQALQAAVRHGWPRCPLAVILVVFHSARHEEVA